MKKLETLGKVLSKNQQRLVFGGSANQELDGGNCTSDADCSNGKVIVCNGEPIQSGPGRCYDSGNGMKCHYSVAC